MAEWLKAQAWKACVRRRTAGSNPALSAQFGELDNYWPAQPLAQNSGVSGSAHFPTNSWKLGGKAYVPKGTVGSNPTLSAKLFNDLFNFLWIVEDPVLN